MSSVINGAVTTKMSEVTRQHMDRVKILRRIVDEANATWVGLQDSLLGEPPTLIFDNPDTRHRLKLSIPWSDLLEVSVQGDIFRAVTSAVQQDVKADADRKVTISAGALRNISEQLHAILDEIDALLR